ncbi:MAG: alternative ribosome rescue aminoacyl-tRNA hydrolase ArfB [Solirubrobacteraceae bacterium]|nr:alternative ribosome rescue aminoacyl-tRNA hydrolase ArfB [Solirubrobacteraceae bacterium]
MPETLRINERLSLPIEEVLIRASRSSGPGGQHANVTSSRIEVVFDVRASATLDDWQRDRILERLGPTVTAVAQETRSQRRNRDAALERLAERLAGALVVQRSRRATKPSRGAKERRLQAKRRTSGNKAGRRKPSHDD